jgi:hypothetical protein
MSKQPKYTPPPKPQPAAGPALVSPAQRAERKATYLVVATNALANAGHEAEDAAAYIHEKYGKR